MKFVKGRQYKVIKDGLYSEYFQVGDVVTCTGDADLNNVQLAGWWIAKVDDDFYPTYLEEFVGHSSDNIVEVEKIVYVDKIVEKVVTKNISPQQFFGQAIERVEFFKPDNHSFTAEFPGR